MANKKPKGKIPSVPTSENSRTAHTRLLDALKEFVQVEPEDQKEPLGKDLMQIAEQNAVNILAFIAPEIGVKVSPVKYASAQIGLFEEFGLQRALIEMKDADPEMEKRPLWLLVHSPGGFIPSSYMIAKRLRTMFTKIVVFIPHVAASGGALIALSANEVVMGDFSRLGPLDPQVAYSPGTDCDLTQVSANCMERAIRSLEDTLRTTSEAEVTVPSRRMTAKLDPILREDWKAELFAVSHYLNELLSKGGYKQKSINSIVKNFVFTNYPHDFVIDKELAKEYGVNVSEVPDTIVHLELMQEWLTKYMLKQEFRHYIRFVTMPEGEAPRGKNKDISKKAEDK